MTPEIPKVYDPQAVEERWYRFWEERGLFAPEAQEGDGRTPYTIVIPPPNITGSLHIGHALDNTIQDILIRWRRMQGYAALWVPGTDHASIATHTKIEEMLAEEGTSRWELGRERFLERAWAWKDKYGSTIINQLKRLGCSCDWSRERFTLDEGCSAAVLDVFVRLYHEGLIYRGHYITNWCPECRTVISDLEVEHQDIDSNLYYLQYPFADGPGHMTVATTRPETMLGDTGVAVHPDDRRYKACVGRTLLLPATGRRIPVVADTYVDPEFGTGAVKVTPAHDPNDFELGRRHDLAPLQVIGKDGRMTEAAGPRYAGLDRLECRVRLLEDLRAAGVLAKTEPISHSVGHCYRCDTAVEPLISEQWFVKMRPLAESAIQVVKEGKIRFVPDRFTKVYLNWMENVHDWCISRQLWWGHRIPAYYCQECDRVTVAAARPDGCPGCGGAVAQDPDVLDTWFSSALWPFSTLGWPGDTADYRRYYPTSTLVTGYDIIFFWVARMIFSALKHTGTIPFRDVLIHGMVRDSQGRKMSKSLNNGVDPLDVIREYGADTLRFTLVTGNTPGNDLRFQWERVQTGRNFANKLWNAARFAQLNLAGYEPGGERAPADLADRWILSRLAAVRAEVTAKLEQYDLGAAASALYSFAWDEFCDWYIELAKPRLAADAPAQARSETQAVLVQALDALLKLLHPFMPFLTEALWQGLPHTGESLMLAPWPPAGNRDLAAEGDMALIMEVTRSLRNLRAELNVPAGKQASAIAVAPGPREARVLRESAGRITRLAALSQLDVVESLPVRPAQAGAAVAAGVELFLPLRDLIDFDKELARLAKELDQASLELAKVEERLQNAGFTGRAPVEVVEKERQRRTELTDKREKLAARLTMLGG